MDDFILAEAADVGQQPERIALYDAQAFAGLRAAGQLAAATLDMLSPHVVPEAVTDELDAMIEAYQIGHGGVPATLGYRGYPKSSCMSVNHVVCHGIPGPRRLKDGDIVNIDVTVLLDGWHGDTSRMFLVGEVGVKGRRLVDVTFEAMWRGIRAARPGARLGDVGHAIQTYAEAQRCSVVTDFCGHGIGRKFHMPPNVVHAGRRGLGLELRPGMVFTIEPMINAGRAATKTLDDGWTAVTRDRQLSAQFEHMVGITGDGCEVFTRSPAGFEKPPYAAD
jgi:methionyl aminopeptidase